MDKKFISIGAQDQRRLFGPGSLIDQFGVNRLQSFGYIVETQETDIYPDSQPLLKIISIRVKEGYTENV